MFASPRIDSHYRFVIYGQPRRQLACVNSKDMNRQQYGVLTGRVAGWWPAAAGLLFFVLLGIMLIQTSQIARNRQASENGAIIPGMTIDAGMPGNPAPNTARAGPMVLVVTSLQSGGPADLAGVRVGDVVEAVNGLPARNQRYIADAARRDHWTVWTLDLRRGGSEIQRRLDMRVASRQ